MEDSRTFETAIVQCGAYTAALVQRYSDELRRRGYHCSVDPNNPFVIRIDWAHGALITGAANATATSDTPASTLDTVLLEIIETIQFPGMVYLDPSPYPETIRMSDLSAD